MQYYIAITPTGEHLGDDGGPFAFPGPAEITSDGVQERIAWGDGYTTDCPDGTTLRAVDDIPPGSHVPGQWSRMTVDGEDLICPGPAAREIRALAAVLAADGKHTAAEIDALAAAAEIDRARGSKDERLAAYQAAARKRLHRWTA